MGTQHPTIHVSGYSFWRNRPLATKGDEVRLKSIRYLKRSQKASTTLALITRKIVTKGEFSMTAPLPVLKPIMGVASKNETSKSLPANGPHFLAAMSYSMSAPCA